MAGGDVVAHVNLDRVQVAVDGIAAVQVVEDDCFAELSPIAARSHHHPPIRDGENGFAHPTVQIHGSVNAVLPRRIESPAFTRLRIAAAHRRHSTERAHRVRREIRRWRRRLGVRNDRHRDAENDRQGSEGTLHGSFISADSSYLGRCSSPEGESPYPALQECPAGFPRQAAALISHQLNRRSDPAVQGDSLKKLFLAGLVAVLGFAPAFALAQAQAEEKMLVGQVQSVDETGTQITLTDGTKLLTPPGSILRPGVLEEGMVVVAVYREENGDKIWTKLSLRQGEPAPSTPGESPKRF